MKYRNLHKFVKGTLMFPFKKDLMNAPAHLTTLMETGSQTKEEDE